MESLREIDSPANPLVKEIYALRLRKHREATGLFVAEGLRTLQDALDRGAAPETLLLGEAARHAPDWSAISQRLPACGTDIFRVSSRVLRKLSQQRNPQPAIATFRQHWTALSDARTGSRSLWVALESVRDPGNLGTILRSATAVGAAGVIQLEGGCDPFSPECVRASMGTIFAQRIIRADLAGFADWRRANGLVVVAAEPRDGEAFQPLDYRLPAVLLMGSEGDGLSDEALALADVRVSIPMRPEAESLNLAVSTAVLLYAIVNRCGLADPSSGPLL